MWPTTCKCSSVLFSLSEPSASWLQAGCWCCCLALPLQISAALQMDLLCFSCCYVLSGLLWLYL
jgi:hypothetical protein